MRNLSGAELAGVASEYERDGFAYVRGLFGEEELAPLIGALGEGAVAPGAFAVTDSAGGKQELSVWLDLGEDLIGVLPRLLPVVAIAEAAIGESVYHWHSKLSWKRPRTTSLWDWHQDYAFWAEDGVERPDMCTVAVALGPITEANGCMQLIRGSHLLGRLPVVAVGQSQGAAPQAVEKARETLDVELCELAMGDAVVFHSNMLHSSGPNQSDLSRTMLMSSYNAVANPPVAPRHPGYAFKPLDVVPASGFEASRLAVFGSTPFVDPMADGMGQGYDVDPVG